MNKKKLINIRKQIDKIDIKLINIIKKRTQLVNKVIKIKKNKKQIVDIRRINEVLSKVKQKSIKKNIDPTITKDIWSTMIKSYIKYERKNFNKK
jgi:chorismate mutase